MKLRGRFSEVLFKGTPRSVFLSGVLNGLLPCGLVYLALAGAAATGEALDGALFMMFFGWGTLPVMFGVVIFGGTLQQNFRSRMRAIYPALMAVMATGLVGPSPAQTEPAAAPTGLEEIQVTARRLNEARNSIQTQTGASTYTVDSAAIAAAPGGDNTLLNQVILQVPSVAQDSFGQFHIRGEHNGLQYRLDGVILPEGVLFGSTGAHQELRRQLIENNRVEAVLSLPGGVFQPYSGVKTSVLFFKKGGSTERVLFLHADFDGYKLDAKHDTPTEADDLPALVETYRQREANWTAWEARDPATEWAAKWWFADAATVRANDFNLSAGRYRPMSQTAVEHRDPRELLDELAAIEAEIVEEVDALRAMLAEQAA